LDIDTAGLGDPADDAAALYAHLIVTVLVNSDKPSVVSACEELAVRWRESWRAREDSSFDDRATAIAATQLLAHALNRLPNTGVVLDRAATLMSNIRELSPTPDDLLRHGRNSCWCRTDNNTRPQGEPHNEQAQVDSSRRSIRPGIGIRRRWRDHGRQRDVHPR